MDPYDKLHQLGQSMPWVCSAADALGAADDGVRRAFQSAPMDKSVEFIEALIAAQRSTVLAAQAGAVVQAQPGTPDLAAVMRKLELNSRQLESFCRKQLKQLKPLVRIVTHLAYAPKSASSKSGKRRSTAVQRYEGSHGKDGCLLCAVSGCEVGPASDVKAGHIYQRRWAPLVPGTAGFSLNGPENVILMHKNIKKKFDQYGMTVMPYTYKVVVLRRELLEGSMACAFEVPETDETGKLRQVRWSDIAGRTLVTRTGCMPSDQALAIHARNAVTYAVGRGWCDAGDEDIKVPGASQADKEILARYLMDQCGSAFSGHGPERQGSPSSVGSPTAASAIEVSSEDQSS